MLVLSGFEKALLGFAQRVGEKKVAVYDFEAMVDVLISRDGMTREEAEEFVEYNCENIWIGVRTPMIVRREF